MTAVEGGFITTLDFMPVALFRDGLAACSGGESALVAEAEGAGAPAAGVVSCARTETAINDANTDKRQKFFFILEQIEI
jgi:hypothetical protein